MKISSNFSKVEEINVPDLIHITITVPYVQRKYTNFVNEQWSQRDIDAMINGYDKVRNGEMTVKEVADRMGKSYSSLKNKAWRMGISKP